MSVHIKFLLAILVATVLCVAVPVSAADWGTEAQQQSYDKLEKDVLKSAGKASDASCDPTKAYEFLEKHKYRNVIITPVQGVTAGLNADFACRLWKFLEAAEGAGYSPVIISGYRSSELQAQLYACYKGTTINYKGKSYTCPSGGRGGLAAAPGNSRHNYGLAADIDDRRGSQATQEWLKWAFAHSETYGIINPPSIRSRDGHHFQLMKGIPVNVGDVSYGGYEEVFNQDQFKFEDTYGDIDTGTINFLLNNGLLNFNPGTNNDNSSGNTSSNGTVSVDDGNATAGSSGSGSIYGYDSLFDTSDSGSGFSLGETTIFGTNTSSGTDTSQATSAGSENQKTCGDIELFGFKIFNTCSTNSTQATDQTGSLDTTDITYGTDVTIPAFYDGSGANSERTSIISSIVSSLYHRPDDAASGGYAYYDSQTNTYVYTGRPVPVGTYDYYSDSYEAPQDSGSTIDTAALWGTARKAASFVFTNTFAPLIYSGVPRFFTY